MKKTKILGTGLLWLTISCLLVSCSGRRTDSSTEETPYQDEKDKKIDALNSSLSRSQLRIEELDAKMTALSDKVESMKITLDNIAGLKPVQTEVVGSNKKEAAVQHEAAPVPTLNKLPLKFEPAVNEFTSAMKLFKAGKYADSELAFNQFTEKNPEHILAGSAQFYAGESYFMMKEYKLALGEYQKVVSSFSNSPRAAAAMTRMAHCYEILGNKTEAERTKALARDLYYGNPSLEISPPENEKEKEKAHESKNDTLEAVPMEPHLETQPNSNTGLPT